jgi:hypothetical protein
MNPKVVISKETNADVNAIAEVTAAAFKTLAVTFHEGFKADGRWAVVQQVRYGAAER